MLHGCCVHVLDVGVYTLLEDAYSALLLAEHRAIRDRTAAASHLSGCMIQWLSAVLGFGWPAVCPLYLPLCLPWSMIWNLLFQLFGHPLECSWHFKVVRGASHCHQLALPAHSRTCSLIPGTCVRATVFPDTFLTTASSMFSSNSATTCRDLGGLRGNLVSKNQDKQGSRRTSLWPYTTKTIQEQAHILFDFSPGALHM